MLQHKTTVGRKSKTSLMSCSNRVVRRSALSRAIQAGLDLLQHILLLIAFLMFFSYVQVATAAEQAATGLLLNNVTDKQAQWVQASQTDLEMRIAEMKNMTVLRQVFYVASLEQLNGKYSFTLHKDAQVESVQIVTNDATKNLDSFSFSPRGENKRYEFQIVISDPQEQLEIKVSYQQPVKYQQGQFQLAVPMMNNQNLNLHVELDAGTAISELTSPSHAIHILEHGAGRYSIRFQDGIIPSHHNFELIWVPEADSKPVPVNLHPAKLKGALLFDDQADNIIHLSAQTATDSQIKLVVGLLCVFLALLVKYILFRFSPDIRRSDRRMFL